MQKKKFYKKKKNGRIWRALNNGSKSQPKPISQQSGISPRRTDYNYLHLLPYPSIWVYENKENKAIGEQEPQKAKKGMINRAISRQFLQESKPNPRRRTSKDRLL